MKLVHPDWWMALLAECGECHYRWAAMFQEGTDPCTLECPACWRKTGVADGATDRRN